jgi:hypothetical protein
MKKFLSRIVHLEHADVARNIDFNAEPLFVNWSYRLHEEQEGTPVPLRTTR